METVKISNTNANGKAPSAVRIYTNGVLISQLFVNKHSPLTYLQTLSRSKHHAQLCDDLTAAMERGVCSIEQANFVKKSVFPLIHG